MPRYIQDPITNRLVPADEYYRPSSRSAAVSDDIEAFVSTVDGTVISSRSGLREHNKRHNVVTAAEYGGHVDKEAKQRRDDHYLGKHSKQEKLARKREIYETINRMERES